MDRVLLLPWLGMSTTGEPCKVASHSDAALAVLSSPATLGS